MTRKFSKWESASLFSKMKLTFIFCVLVLVRWSLEQRFTKFNGGFSKDQLDWLDSVLSSADEKGEKVTIVSK